jgi:hypothetical protein
MNNSGVGDISGTTYNGSASRTISYNTIGAIGGTGTSGQVAFWNGTSSQTGDNGLFWDNVNKRLGVGTSTPRYFIDVLGSLPGPRIVSFENTTHASQIRLRSSAAEGNITMDGTGGVISGGGLLFNSSSNIFHFMSAGTSRMVFKNNNLLINTTTDAGFRLDVNGTARVQGVLTTTADAVVNGVNIGLGNNSVSTNTRVGSLSLASITTGTNNLAFGLEALRFNLVGNNNCAFGVQALRNNLNTNNSAFGNLSFYRLNSGSENVAFGSNSGSLTSLDADLTSVSNSVFIGFNTKANANSQTNQIVIGHTAIGLGSNTTVIGNSSTTFGRWYGSLLLGTTTNAASSILTMESTTQGFLPPRMTAAQRTAIASPAEGLIVYQTDSVIGLYIYSSSTWRSLTMV